MEHHIGALDQIPPGEGRNFKVGPATVAVFRTHGGEVFATQPDCPHRRGPLADGLMGGSIIVCPLHDRAWDLRTGEPTGADCTLTTYGARVTVDGSILLSLPD